ncbi:MAG: recombination regulator RecX, partial [Lachnospiraceae bacterium]|nr:recombination regulator RecX [Lachnospiraceae bacterium]
MLVTKIQEYSKKRYQVWLDGEVAFVLYKGDLRHYEIREGEELDEAVRELIQKEVLSKRAEKRALHLLEKRDYTAAGLQRKLTQGGYSEEIAKTVVEIMKGYRYLDDARYADQYIHCYSGRKTRRAICAKLAEKGIAKDVIAAAYERFDEEGNEADEENMAVQLLKKRHYDGGPIEKKEMDRH